MNTSSIVQKLWNYCNVLRDDGMSYGDYVEQLTCLLFLKMANERTKSPYNQVRIVPDQYGWPGLLKRDGDELFKDYRFILESLGNKKNLLGLIFGKSQNKFQDPAKLQRLIVDLIDKENWSMMSSDVKGDAYEGLLEKNAQDLKSGAGQYFTPRAVILHHNSLYAESVLEIISFLDRLRQAVEETFPSARSFIRPGFDRIDLSG